MVKILVKNPLSLVIFLNSDRLELSGEKKSQGQSQYKLPIACLTTGDQASLFASGQGNEYPNDDRDLTTVGIVSAPIW